jgi:hypothetical protein
MRFVGIMRACGAAIAALAVVSPTGFAQTRSATVRVSAQVIDVASLAPAPYMLADLTGADATPDGAAASADAAGRSFSVVPPRHSPVAVSLRVRGAGAPDRPPMAIRICLPPSAGDCRQVLLEDTPGGAEAQALTRDPVLVSLVDLMASAGDDARVTLTLAYPDS